MIRGLLGEALLDITPLTCRQTQAEDAAEAMRLPNRSVQREATIDVIEQEFDPNSSSSYKEAITSTDFAFVDSSFVNSSEVHWLQAVATARSKKVVNNDGDSLDSKNTCRNDMLLSLCNLWPNDEGIGANSHIDPYELPSLTVINQLLAVYTSTAHESFPSWMSYS